MGKGYPFSDASIQEAIEKIKNVPYRDLSKTNEVMYNIITFGTTLQKTIELGSKSFNLNYIEMRSQMNYLKKSKPGLSGHTQPMRSSPFTGT